LKTDREVPEGLHVLPRIMFSEYSILLTAQLLMGNILHSLYICALKKEPPGEKAEAP
jgi:hypothetical protein